MAGDRYFVCTPENPYWHEVDEKGFMNVEQRAGFHSKFGPDHLATAGFGSSMKGQEFSGVIVSPDRQQPSDWDIYPAVRDLVWGERSNEIIN